MAQTEKKKSPWGLILGLIVLGGILFVALYDFVPQQTTQEVVIQHTID